MEFIHNFVRAFNPDEPGFLFMWGLLALGLLALILMVNRYLPTMSW